MATEISDLEKKIIRQIEVISLICLFEKRNIYFKTTALLKFLVNFNIIPIIIDSFKTMHFKIIEMNSNQRSSLRTDTQIKLFITFH